MEPAVPLLDPRFAGRERQPGLDLLRAAAVTMVVFFHAGLFGFVLPRGWQWFGWVGVDLFFVLSGYLIGGQLLGRLRRGKGLDLPRFFRRRALRILPAYLVVLTLYTLAPAMREFPTMPPWWKFAAFVQNLGLQGGTALSHAWALCVEGQFYLLLPFVLLLLARWRHGGIVAAVGIIVAGGVLRGALAYSSWDPDGGGVDHEAFQTWIYYDTWTRLDPLVLGVGLAAVEQMRPAWWTRLLGSARWLLPVGVAAVAFGFSLGDSDKLTVTAAIWEFPLIALGMAALLVCAVSERLPLRRVAVPGAAFVASIAYSVYLSHKLVIHAVIGFCAARGLALDSAAAIGLNAAGMFLVGTVLFFAVERPFLQLRRASSS